MRTDSKKIKFIAVIACVVLVLAASIGATVAYIIDQQTVTLTYNTPKFVMVGNDDGNFVYNGNVPVYFRFSVTTPNSTIDSYTVAYDSSWTAIGDYYYYNGIVQVGSGTIRIPEITVSGSENATETFTIVAEICQIEPESAVKESWGVSYDNGNGLWTSSTPTNP